MPAAQRADGAECPEEGWRLLGVTCGCAKQHRSVTALFFLSVIAVEFGIVMDRAISCAGHKKSSTGALSGAVKNTIISKLGRKVQTDREGNGRELTKHESPLCC